MTTLIPKHSGKELIAAVNRWNPGTKATSTFLNDCSASEDFMWLPPEQGSGKWKRYNDIHLLEFGMQCVFKAMSVPRDMSKKIIKEIRKQTRYHRAKSQAELEQNLKNYALLFKNSKSFISVRNVSMLTKIFEGKSSASNFSLHDKDALSHALVLIPQEIFYRLVK